VISVAKRVGLSPPRGCPSLTQKSPRSNKSA
jgi:hypothetical protein